MSKSMFSVVFALSHQFEYVILRLDLAPRRVSFRVGWLALLFFCAWAHHHHNSFYFIFHFLRTALKSWIERVECWRGEQQPCDMNSQSGWVRRVIKLWRAKITTKMFQFDLSFSAVSRSIITPGLKRWGICRVKIKDRILYRRNTAERRRRWQCPEEHDKDLHCFYTTVSTWNWHSLATMLLARLVSRFLDYFFFLLIFVAVTSCRSVTLSSFSHRSRHRTAHKRLLKLS